MMMTSRSVFGSSLPCVSGIGFGLSWARRGPRRRHALPRGGCDCLGSGQGQEEFLHGFDLKGVGPVGLSQTLFQAGRDDGEAGPVQGPVGRRELGDDVLAVAALLDHSQDAADLALRSTQSVDHVAHLCRVELNHGDSLAVLGGQDAVVAPCGSATLFRMWSMSSPRIWAMTCSSAEAGSDPGWLKTRMPSRKAISVGMDVIRAVAASDCSASVSTLPKMMSGWLTLALSKTGAKARHGPHQAAQKSTSTMSLLRTVCSKDAAVSAWVVIWLPLDLHHTSGGINVSAGMDIPVWDIGWGVQVVERSRTMNLRCLRRRSGSGSARVHGCAHVLPGADPASEG